MIAARRCSALGAWLMSFSAAAQICGTDLPGSPTRIEHPQYVLAWVSQPKAIPFGEHFTLDFAVCPRTGVRLPRSVRIEATMPEHRHGMNYRPVVTERRPGDYHAEGLLFHMAGRWELAFDLVDGDRVERLTSAVQLE